MGRNRKISNLKVKKRNQQKTEIRLLKEQRRKQEKQSLKNIDLVIGMDNGSTGTICSWIIGTNQIDFKQTPSKRECNYQKQINYIDRLNHEQIKSWLKNNIKKTQKLYKREIRIIIIIERPMVNPQRFDASLNAVRAFQSLLVILQQLNIKYLTIDSKQWQHYFFGKDTSFMDLKFESLKMGINVFNQIQPSGFIQMIDIIRNHGDADALLITKYAIEKLIKNAKL